MTGLVQIQGAPTTPPGVPDGVSGRPMTATKLDADGSTLSVSWDTTSCAGAADHEILYGVGSQLPSAQGSVYGLEGAQCAIGVASPFTWVGSPDPATTP